MTIGDVAAEAGVRTSEAEEALNALAADCNASIQVCVFETIPIQWVPVY